MEKTKLVLIFALLMLVSCTQEAKEEQPFKEDQEKDCGCDDVDTTQTDN